MASYNVIRTAESQPIGTAVPWVGGLTEVPPGWLICNGQELEAFDYPLLARVIRTTYGGNFSGDFPNYTGTFILPNPNQKTLADISTEYFTSNQVTPGADQPTLNIDDAAALAVIGPFIGPEGDVGTPGTTFAITDLNFSYQPDPDGTVLRITDVTGTAATTAIPKLWTDIESETNNNGDGATFNVVQNTDNTYQVSIRVKGSGYDVGDTITIKGGLVGGTDGVNDISFTVSRTGNPFFEGTIQGSNGSALEFVPGFDIETIFIVPRKLGREHFPAHSHPGSYPTTDTGDTGSQTGRGVGVFENPEIVITEAWFGLNPRVNFITGAREYEGSDNLDVGNTWGDSDITQEVNTILCPFTTGVGRYTVGSASGTPPARTHTALETGSGGHGIGKSWFTNAKRLRDKQGNTTPGNAALEAIRQTGRIEATSLIPFSDQASPINKINYDLGTAGGLGSDNTVPPTKVMFNHAANSFTKITRTLTQVNDVIQPHDHQGEINITFDNGNLAIPGSLTANVTPNVIPDSIPNAFQVEFNATSPSMSCITLIRAY